MIYFSLILLLFVTVLVSLYSYVGKRLLISKNLPPHSKTIYWSILIFSAIIVPVSMLLNRLGYEGAWWYDVLWQIAFYTLGFFIILFFLVLIRDLFLLMKSVWQKLSGSSKKLAGSDSTVSNAIDVDRRAVLIKSVNIGMIGISGMVFGYGTYEATRQPDIENVVVPIKGYSQDLQSFRLVQITDLHVGPSLKRGYVENLVRTINKLKPDVVAITGDLVDGTVANLSQHVAPLKNLCARYGTFFVTGNHEYYSGVNEWLTELRRLGLNVLLNEHQIIRHGSSNILLAGVTDYKSDRYAAHHISSPKKALAGSPAADVKILLAHQPKNIYTASELGYDLQISGHTHGGQFYPWRYLVKLDQPYISGLHRHKNTWIYVSRGTGYWGPPLRLASSPEITLIRFNQDSNISRLVE